MTELELKYQVLRFYEINPEKAKNFKVELEELKKSNNFTEVVFPYKETKELLKAPLKITPNQVYNTTKVQITEGLSVFYPAEYSLGYCDNATHLLMCEQSVKSPHRYVNAPQNCTILDVGCSEGYFSRVYCNESNQIIGFDNESWVNAYLNTCSGLDAYFMGVFINKNFLTDSLLTHFEQKPLGCIKIDTEGSEIEVLEVLEPFIKDYHPQIQVAVYHYLEEFNQVIDWLKSRGYTEFGQVNPESWMLYPNDDIQFEPYFRHGVIIST